MASRFGTWLDERISWRSVWENIFLRKIPKVNWFYTLGSATLFVVVNQIFTGILLTIYYVPTPDHAWASVNYITTQVPAGWFIRGLHHYGASAMVVLAILHMVRVIFTGSYKYPREITWFTGVFLLLLTIAFGFTGYLLPWDQRAYWATVVGTSIAGTAPGVGESVMLILRGGEDLTAITLARFFGVHVWFLPITLIALVTVHLYLVIRLGISAPVKKGD